MSESSKKKLSPEALAALDVLNTSYNEAKSVGGDRFSEWPPEGSHGCVITEIQIRPIDNMFTKTKGEKPGFFVQFCYTTLEPIPGTRNPDESLDWRGRSYKVVADPSVYAQNGQKDDPEWVLSRDLNELKDALSIVNQRPGTTLKADLGDAASKVSVDRCVVMLRVTSKPNAKKPDEPYRTEYINENITAKS